MFARNLSREDGFGLDENEPVCDEGDWFRAKAHFNTDLKGNFEMHLLTHLRSIIIIIVVVCSHNWDNGDFDG